jgi:hypothetical protein
MSHSFLMSQSLAHTLRLARDKLPISGRPPFVGTTSLSKTVLHFRGRHSPLELTLTSIIGLLARVARSHHLTIGE